MIDRGGKMMPMRGDVTVFDDGSEVQESVCERYCVHTDGGACTGHLTEDGTQLHSRMRRWRRGEWVRQRDCWVAGSQADK